MWRIVAIVAALFISHALAFFRLGCGNPLVLERADSIVSPGDVSSHVHTILGGDGFNFTQTYDTLRASSCSTCEAVADLSNYWTPSLYYRAQNGTVSPVTQVGGATIYYLQRNSTLNESLYAFPAGLRMIAGDTALRTFNASNPEQLAVSHNCLDYSGQPTQTNNLPTMACPDGIRTQLFFPSCWDGVNLDSADHKSHMAYLSGMDTGSCPSSHPVHLISLFYEIIWSTAPFNSEWWTPPGAESPFVLSNGDPTGYGFHGDFVNGWDVSVLQQAVDECTDLSGDITVCSALSLRPQEEMTDCARPTRVAEQTAGWLTALPGCNPIYPSTDAPAGCNATVPIIPADEASFLAPVEGWTARGCANDSGTVRILPNRWADPSMTPALCAGYCTTAFAGVEYGDECWCGDSADGAQVGSLACDMPCAGDETLYCGAPSRLALYERTGLPPPNTVAPSSPANPQAPMGVQPTCRVHKGTLMRRKKRWFW